MIVSKYNLESLEKDLRTIHNIKKTIFYTSMKNVSTQFMAIK